jgi:hypothetical protein
MGKGLRLYEPGLDFYVKKLRGAEPFTFARYGDSEWVSIVGCRKAMTYNGLTYRMDLPGLRDALMRTLREIPAEAENYYPATRTAMNNNKKDADWNGEFRAWVLRNDLEGLPWHGCNVFAWASEEGRLWPFIQAIRDLDAPRVVIGPPWLRQLDDFVFPIEHFVQVPLADCWTSFDRILKEALAAPKHAFYSISAGLAAKVLAWRLYQDRGDASWIVDLGSLWDPYVNILSRDPWQSAKPGVNRKLIAKNLGLGKHRG